MPETSIQDKAKEAAGIAAANLIQNGMTVGLGTGSTVAFFIAKLAERKLKIKAIATSIRSHDLAKQLGIPLLEEIDSLDIAVDGADEIDKSGNMIKGGGGALLREKIVASMAKKLIIIVDEKKQVDKLGAFPLPVEISPFCYTATLEHLKRFNPQLRKYRTDNGNYIADLHIKSIDNATKLNTELQNIPGVLETGLFLNLNPTVLIGHADGKTTTIN